MAGEGDTGPMDCPIGPKGGEIWPATAKPDPIAVEREPRAINQIILERLNGTFELLDQSRGTGNGTRDA